MTLLPPDGRNWLPRGSADRVLDFLCRVMFLSFLAIVFMWAISPLILWRR